MGRPPSNGGPSFRFNPTEVAEMESILLAHNCLVPQREILVGLAEKFSNSPDRSGKPPVQMKQVWNWFQNRRYALRAKSTKSPAKLNVSPMPQHDLAAARNVPQAPQHPSIPAANARNVPQVPQPVPTPTVESAGKNGSDTSQMEFEAKSARDGAWYDVASFLSHRSLETNDPEVLVRFSGFGAEEDEWVNVRKHVRQRSLPCESSECVAVLPGDLILCFQEGKEQALYFDAHVLDAQKRRHDVRGCRCRFLVRYDHDQSEEIVPLRKVCRRPETDYRMQLLHAESTNVNQNKTASEPNYGNSLKAYPPAEATLKQPKVEGPDETMQKPGNTEVQTNSGPLPAPISHATSTAPTSHSSEPLASAAVPSPQSIVSAAPTTAFDANSGVPGATVVAPVASSVPVASMGATIANSSVHGATSVIPVTPITAPIANSSIHGATIVATVASSVFLAPTVAPIVNSSLPGATNLARITSSVPPAVAPVADSTVPTAQTMAPAANSSDPISPAAATVANSSVPVASTAKAPISDSGIPVAMTAEAPFVSNSSVPIASTAEAPIADSNVPIAMTAEAPGVANSSVPIASTAKPPIVYSNVPLAVTVEAPVADSSVPIASTAEASILDSNIPVAMSAEAPVIADSSVPTTSTAEAPIADSNIPVAMTAEAPVANSSVPVASTVEAPNADSNDVPVAMTVEAPIADNSGVPIASTGAAPVVDSNVLDATTDEAPVATNSGLPEATTKAPVASDVPAVTESDEVWSDRVSESEPGNNIDSINAQSGNLTSIDTIRASEEEAGESMQLG